MMLEIGTAAELIDPALEERWKSRRDERRADVLQRIRRASGDAAQRYACCAIDALGIAPMVRHPRTDLKAMRMA